MEITHNIKNNYTLYIDDNVVYQSDDKMFILGKFFDELSNNHNVKVEDQNHRVLVCNYKE